MEIVKLSDINQDTPNYKTFRYVSEVIIRGETYRFTGDSPADVMDQIEHESISRIGWKKARWIGATYEQWKAIYAEIDKRPKGLGRGLEMNCVICDKPNPDTNWSDSGDAHSKCIKDLMAEANKTYDAIVVLNQSQ